MTLRLSRNIRVSVDRNSVAEITGKIEQPKRRFLPARRFVINPKAPARGISSSAHALFAVVLTATGGDGQYSCYGPAVIHQEKHLPIQVHLDMPVPWILCLRLRSISYSVELAPVQLACCLAALHLL